MFLLQKDEYNFEDTIKTFSQNVPALNHLTLNFKNEIEIDYVDLFRRNFGQLRNKYYKINKGISLNKTRAILGNEELCSIKSKYSL